MFEKINFNFRYDFIIMFLRKNNQFAMNMTIVFSKLYYHYINTQKIVVLRCYFIINC